MDEQQRQPDDGWLDDWALGGDAPADDLTPQAVLRQIANDQGQPGTARVAAIKLLLDRGLRLDDEPTVDDRFTFNLAGLSGDKLDRELAGYFDNGWQPPGGPDGEHAPALDERLAAVVDAIGAEATTTRYPRTAARLAALVERHLAADTEERVQARLAEMGEKDEEVPKAATQPVRPEQPAPPPHPSSSAQEGPPFLPPPMRSGVGVFPDEVEQERHKLRRRRAGLNPFG